MSTWQAIGLDSGADMICHYIHLKRVIYERMEEEHECRH